jgi:NADPH-dependent 2,4-dienoyl-CoA reductase/sulfur reductase-like enzyme
LLTKDVDIAIIGVGSAGMAAAIRTKEMGVDNIIMVERAEYPGGLLHQCIHNGFGLQYFKQDLTGPEYAERFITKLASMGTPICLNTMVTHLYPDRSIIAINPDLGEFKILPRAVVLAMGCRERTRASLGIPGSRPSGIFTAGLAQKLVNVDGYLPGEEFVILGSGDIGMIMARRLLLEGATVKAVVEIMPHVGGLVRNEVQCLHDFEIPLLLEHTITEIYGDGRLEGVKVAQVDKGEVVKGSERDIRCDTLLLSVGLVPENELSREAGVLMDDATGGPVIDEFMQTTIEGIFAAGNVLQVYDLVDNVTLAGEKAGENAARYVEGTLRKQPTKIDVIAGENVRSLTPHKIVGLEGAELALRVKQLVENAEIVVGNKRRRYRAISPTEVMKINLSPSDLSQFWECGKISVSCLRRQNEEVDE